MDRAHVFASMSLGDRAARVRDDFSARGVNVSEWARARGFDPGLVHQILRGERRCTWGKSHRIAVALGIKDAPAVDAAPAPVPGCCDEVLRDAA